MTLPVSGTYTILVHASYYNDQAGYQLSVQSVTGECASGSPVLCGQTVTGQISNHGQLEAHPMPLNGGEHIILSASGFGTMLVDLYDPLGTLVSSIGSGGTMNLTLASTGVYLVVVHASNYSSTGAYSLSLTVFGGCDRVSLGSTIVLTQHVACLPVQLSSSSPVTWVSFFVQAPTNLLDNPTLLAIPQFTNALIIPVTNSEWFVTMQTDPGAGVMGPTNIAMLCFNAVATQSAFVPVLLSDLVITNQGGGVPGATGFGGRVVIVADQPLLEASLGTNRQRLLTIYGHPNTDYEIDYSTNLGAPSPWLPGWTNTVPATLSLSGPIPGPQSNAPVLLLRAQQR